MEMFGDYSSTINIKQARIYYRNKNHPLKDFKPLLNIE